MIKIRYYRLLVDYILALITSILQFMNSYLSEMIVFVVGLAFFITLLVSLYLFRYCGVV